MYSYMKKAALLVLASLLQFMLFAYNPQVPQVVNEHPDPENIFVELIVGPTNKELLATARMIIHNNDPQHALTGGSLIRGQFTPSWKLFLNGQYKAAKTEHKVMSLLSTATSSYCQIAPTESFGKVLPGTSVEIELVSKTPFQALAKISKATNMAGLHITFENDHVAHFVPLHIEMDDLSIGTCSRLPMEFCTEMHVCDEVEQDSSTLRYAKGVKDTYLALQDKIVPRPYFLSQGTGYVRCNHLGIVRAESRLFFEANYLKGMLEQDHVAQNSIDIELKVASFLIPELDLEKNGKNIPEGYVLRISNDKIEIVGSDKAGVFYGIQTLRQLLSIAKIEKSGLLPVVVIVDAPRFFVRTHLLDVARHFVPKEDLFTYIDLLSQFKINTLHLHLSDNEGWRLEIPELDELVSYGAKRAFSSNALEPAFGTADNIIGTPVNEEVANFWVKPAWQGFEDAMNNFVGMGSGFYTTKDFEEILIFAEQRNIEVICEIDLPAHARAAIESMEYRYQKYKDTNPELANEFRLIDPKDSSEDKRTIVNPSLKSTYNFVNKVFKEVKARYDAAKVPFKAFHIGCDEVPGVSENTTWSKSPEFQKAGYSCKELLTQFVMIQNYIINSLGATTHIWAESLDSIRDDKSSYELLKRTGVVVHPWNNIWAGPKQSACYELANDGFKVVLAHASNLYLDMMQAKHPQEIGMNYAGFLGLEEVFSYMPENYAASYLQKDFFGDSKNTFGSTLGQILDPIALIKTQATLLEKDNLQGIEVCLWTESCKNYKNIEYMAFPRIIAAAERAWNRNPPVDAMVDPELPEEILRKKLVYCKEKIAKAWTIFANCLGKYTLPMLDLTQEVNYRMPMPGAIIEEGILYMNSSLPGFELQYSEDSGAVWKAWNYPVCVPGRVLVRSVAFNGKTSRIDMLE